MSLLQYLFEDIQSFENPLHITIRTDKTVVVDKMGTISLSSNIKLQNVLYIPQFSCNLISIHKFACDLKCIVTYSFHAC